MDKQKLKRIASYLGSQGMYKEAAQIIKVAQSTKTMDVICNEINMDIRYGNVLRARVGREENFFSQNKDYIIIGFEPSARQTMTQSQRQDLGEEAIREHLPGSKYIDVKSRGTVTATEDKTPGQQYPFSENLIDTVPPSKKDRFNTGTTKVFYYELIEQERPE